MTSNYIFLALCLLLIQIPGFLTKPSDFDGYGDERRWGGDQRGELNSYYSPKTMHAGFDNSYKLSGKKIKSNQISELLRALSKLQLENLSVKEDVNAKDIAWAYYDEQ